MLEGLQEGGIAEEPLQAHLQHTRVVQRPRADEVLHELCDGVVGEEGQVKGLRVVKQLFQLLIIPRPHACGHCRRTTFYTLNFAGSAAEGKADVLA